MGAAPHARHMPEALHHGTHPMGGVRSGSNAGSVSRIASHQSSGTGGLRQDAGSVSCVECAGMTSVPVPPTASSSASTTA